MYPLNPVNPVFNYTQPFSAERRALRWRENEFSLHLLPLKSGKWRRRRIEIHLIKRNVWIAAEEKKTLLIGSELQIFFHKLIIWESNTNLDRRDSLK